jgi:hypothetical protein
VPAVYNKLDVQFLYPENWSIVDEEQTDWPRTVTLQSQETSFWTLLVYPPREPTGPLIDHVIETIREEYKELELLEAKESFGGTDSTGVDICFFYLDLLVEAKIRVISTPAATLLLHYQAESREFDDMQPVFRAITYSLLGEQVVPGADE